MPTDGPHARVTHPDGPTELGRAEHRIGRSGWVAAAAILLLASVAVASLSPLAEVLSIPSATIELAGHPVKVGVADSEARRSWGLQGLRDLPDGQGMLFVFPAPKEVAFARKAVPFPLDVIFVGRDLHVSGITRLDTAHDIAQSPGTALYVIEVPGGWSARNGVRVGSPFEPPAR